MRRFKRYPGGSVLNLKLRNRSLRARLIDYSVDGLGVVIDDTTEIAKGEIVHLNAQDPAIDTFGEVVWSTREGFAQKIGLKSIGLLKGLLKDFGLADVLIGLQRSSKTGILTVESGAVAKKVYIKNGDMVFSSSNCDEDRLGDVLLREEWITHAQYDHSESEMKKTGERRGKILVRLGHLGPRELGTAVRYQVEEIILSLFTLEGGNFTFEERPLPTEEVITLKLSAANLIYNGIKGIKDLSLLGYELPPIETVLSLSQDPLDLFQDIKLDRSATRIISYIDGRTSIGDIISITQMDGFEALKTVHALMSIRMVEVREAEEPESEIPETVREEILEEKVVKETDPAVREMIEDVHGRYEALGYYGILEVKEHAPAADIKKAYYKAAKKFHPDMHFHVENPELKDKLSDIFTYVYEAYATLTNSAKRAEYDRSMTVKPAKLKANNEKARAKFEEGKAEFGKENYPEASLLFGQATYFDTTIADYHYYYGLALIKQKKIKEAEKALGRALKLEPYNAHCLAELGFVYMDLGFLSRARGFFERALKASPGNARASEGLSKTEPS